MNATSAAGWPAWWRSRCDREKSDSAGGCSGHLRDGVWSKSRNRGLVPSEHSSGSAVRRGGITKAGNLYARRALIEGASRRRLREVSALQPFLAAALNERGVPTASGKGPPTINPRGEALSRVNSRPAARCDSFTRRSSRSGALAEGWRPDEYGTELTWGYHLMGANAGRLLKGSKAKRPAGRFELAVNLKTAKALGLTIPETLKATADS
jgi:Transposase IS116/IS110/IS902 family